MKRIGTIWGHVFGSYPCIRHNEDSEDRTDYLFSWSSHILLNHLQLKNANLMGQVVSSSGTFPASPTSLYSCVGKTVKLFFYYYLFQRITLLPRLRLHMTNSSAMRVLYVWAINQSREERIFIIEMLTHHINCISMNCGTTVKVLLIWLKMNTLLRINCNLIRVLL